MKVVTCGCMSSVEDGVEAAGVSVGGMGDEVVTCGCLSSVQDGVEAAGVSVRRWAVKMFPTAVYSL